MSIPVDLIHEIRTHFRARSGLPNYDPSSVTTTSLPSLEESISQFGNSSDSTDNVRCKSCKGKLLRGASSVICVYCGEEQFNIREENNVALAESLKFRETVGFKWLLDALKLDGSETVGPLVEEIQLRRGQTSNKYALSLSDLLDLEIRWEGNQRSDATYFTDNSTQNRSSLNLAGVNPDTFFTEANKDPILSASGDDFGANTQKQSIESRPLEIHGSVNLFENFETAKASVHSSENVQIAERSVQSTENVQPSQASLRSTEGEIIDRFSGWEAEFQSTSSVREGSNSVGAFGSSAVDLSMHIDTVFGPERDLENKLTTDSASDAPMTSAWGEDDIWSNFNSGGAIDQPSLRFKDGSAQNRINTPTINDDLIEGLQWQPSSSKVPNDDAIDVNDDSFDDWNDFASSSTSGKPYSNPGAQNFDQSLPSAKQLEEVNFFSSGNTFLNTGGGNSVDTDFFSNSFGDSNNLAKVNDLMSERSSSNRANSDYVDEEKPSQPDGKLEDNVDAVTGSKVDYVGILMSQMHDLSFMLESDLSLPKS